MPAESAVKRRQTHPGGVDKCTRRNGRSSWVARDDDEGKMELERAGRLLAALREGAGALRDEDLSALRADLDRLHGEANEEAHARAEARHYEAEAARRRERTHGRERRRAAREAARDRLPRSARRWAEHQYRSCGKGTCTTCGGTSVSGGHGPYWYLYFRESPGGPVRSRYVGRFLNAEAAEALAALELRREASARRTTLVREILAGRQDDVLGLEEPVNLDDVDEGRPGWKELVGWAAERLLGLTPEEVFPKHFNPETVETARATRLRKERCGREGPEAAP